MFADPVSTFLADSVVLSRWPEMFAFTCALVAPARTHEWGSGSTQQPANEKKNKAGVLI